ncbi:unnamed protein product [Phytophthora fragariaefolia]|uniref:Unnamed protein product n=1 Tax=Phytophthora fragariaefolia TaxID=1490495 RepID=A0A9W6TX70_9STRA|nr:unnamed protein product [Phytophthora fragariaefolia]
MEVEERRYQRQLRRLERQEQQKQEQELAERERAQAEALRRQQEKEQALNKERVRVELKKQEVAKQAEANAMQMDEEEPKKSKLAKPKVRKNKTQPKQVEKKNPAPPKRITPVSLPPAEPEDVESASEENQIEVEGYDSPPPELPDDGLLNVLSLDKGSDTEIDDEPSMVSLILPVAQSPPKAQPSPMKKKTLTPQKRFTKKKAGPPLDFNFTNAEARRQAKAVDATAHVEDGESGDADTEPEPMPVPSAPTPKKRLNRRKELSKGKKTNDVTTSTAGKILLAAMANVNVAIKPKKGVVAGRAKLTTSGSNQPATGASTVSTSKATQGKKHKAKDAAANVVAGNPTSPLQKKKVNGKGETLSIKQRLANAELLARMNKMQDMNTPKVFGKKMKKTQKNDATKMAAAKRTEFREILRSHTAEVGVPERDQAIEERDLNISLNSSGLISDNDSPENLRAPLRKRPRGGVEADVTPTKKLQFLEITKRLAKSPMPRYLRTPTPLMSPVVAPALIKPKAASPGPRGVSAHSTTAKDYSARRMNSAPVRPKKTSNANRFGIPAGGASTAASGGGFSMFDAFVNSGSGAGIPRLKTKAQGGDASPSV